MLRTYYLTPENNFTQIIDARAQFIAVVNCETQLRLKAVNESGANIFESDVYAGFKTPTQGMFTRLTVESTEPQKIELWVAMTPMSYDAPTKGSNHNLSGLIEHYGDSHKVLPFERSRVAVTLFSDSPFWYGGEGVTVESGIPVPASTPVKIDGSGELHVAIEAPASYKFASDGTAVISPSGDGFMANGGVMYSWIEDDDGYVFGIDNWEKCIVNPATGTVTKRDTNGDWIVGDAGHVRAPLDKGFMLIDKKDPQSDIYLISQSGDAILIGAISGFGASSGVYNRETDEVWWYGAVRSGQPNAEICAINRSGVIRYIPITGITAAVYHIVRDPYLNKWIIYAGGKYYTANDDFTVVDEYITVSLGYVTHNGLSLSKRFIAVHGGEFGCYDRQLNRKVSLPTGVLALYPFDDELVAMTNQYIYTSIDAGVTWQVADDISELGLGFQSSGRVYNRASGLYMIAWQGGEKHFVRLNKVIKRDKVQQTIRMLKESV